MKKPILVGSILFLVSVIFLIATNPILQIPFIGIASELSYIFPSHRPDVAPPVAATDVHFSESSGWQSWDYFYRFDAPRDVCYTFAVSLLRKHAITDIKIIEHPLISISHSDDFPKWFDVDSVRHGTVLSLANSDWVYAVIDDDRHRFYYHGSN